MQIKLLCNSSNSSPNSLLNSFYIIFPETIQFDLKFFYPITILDLLDIFGSKIYYSICKKSSWLIDLVFEICLDCKFPFQREILKKCLPKFEIELIIFKFLIRSPLIFLSRN